jgi:D-alanyl-D-alanine carboxypeptidase (penicillin-binding protein 5/6)
MEERKIQHRKKSSAFITERGEDMKVPGYKDNLHKKKCRRKKRIGMNILICLGITIALAGLFLVVRGNFIFSKHGINRNSSEQQQNIQISDRGIDVENLYSPYAILIDLKNDKILAQHNSRDRIYPASLTKIMTAILAIENTDDLDEMIKLPTYIFEKLYEENASMAGFKPGEEVSLKDLLYGILLPSGAESCITFANRISGSEEEFVELMNQKAEELGMNNTHFYNSTGLHEENHYSTVEDISILLRYALKNENFREVFTSSRYSTQPSKQHLEGLTFQSTMSKYMDSTEVPGGEILGGKTGYTKKAGLCLASLVNVKGKEYILVTAKANGTHNTDQFHILDAINVYSQIGVAETIN